MNVLINHKRVCKAVPGLILTRNPEKVVIHRWCDNKRKSFWFISFFNWFKIQYCRLPFMSSIYMFRLHIQLPFTVQLVPHTHFMPDVSHSYILSSQTNIHRYCIGQTVTRIYHQALDISDLVDTQHVLCVYCLWGRVKV